MALRLLATITFLILNVALISANTKTKNTRPVHETIIEQKNDKVIKPILPYINPLAGNPQNSKMHIQTQQAMFNAEKVRQHRAQLQRWTAAPQKVDSYMKAYHESQETHQIALEQQQSRNRPNKNEKRHISPKNRMPEFTKFTKEDAVFRHPRSKGDRHFPAKRQQTIRFTAGPTYDQGVTIKPYGSVGLGSYKPQPELKLYTTAVPSLTQHVYPKQHIQMQTYQSAQDIETLNSLLKKQPDEQLEHLNSLIQSSKDEKQTNEEAPVDLYFYLKDNQENSLTKHYESVKYAQLPETSNFQQAEEQKDHTPIMENVDDIADPNEGKKIAYGSYIQPTQQTPKEEQSIKSNNYYKIEVSNQVYRKPKKPSVAEAQSQIHISRPVFHPEVESTPTYAPQYFQQTYVQEPKQQDLSKLYLHHNAQHQALHHLSDDGDLTSYGGHDNLQYAANYEFGYRVRDYHTGNDFGHQETKDGEETKGFYHVLLPDGRMQNVKYIAGPDGFHADISYDHLNYEQHEV